MPANRLPIPRTRMISTYKIKDMIEKGIIHMDAPYQRDIVWNEKKMTHLVDSILSNYYIPPVLFVVRKIRGKPVRIVIDGKQRLTSVSRFMKNLIPYKDTSNTTPVDRYYSKDVRPKYNEEESAMKESLIPPKHFLGTEDFDAFNAFEFVCIEYSEVSEEEEVELFTRVQMGVALTSAEQLKAHSTTVVKFCDELSHQNSAISKKLIRKGQSGVLFKLIAQLLSLIAFPIEEFKAGVKLVEFVSSNYVPSSDIKERMENVLGVLNAMANDEQLLNIFLKRDDKVLAIKPLEFLLFGKFISMVQRPRSLKAYAGDFAALREHLYETRDGKYYVGKPALLEVVPWIDARLESYNLRSNALHSEEDELKYDEYEPDEDTEIQEATPPPPVQKRRRGGGGEERSMNVARRGGRFRR